MISATPGRAWTPPRKFLTAGILIAWAAVAYLIGVTGLVEAPASQAFRPVALTVFGPVAVFVAAYAISARFRDFVLAQDLRTLTMLQHWRVVGFAFLALYAFDALPALFAWPAGVGDVAIGLTAPFVVARLGRDAAFARSWRFLSFHALGMLDFGVAIVTATLASGAFPKLMGGEVTTAAMEVWPLNLFPSFIVPIFIILHLSVFLKVRALRRAEGLQTLGGHSAAPAVLSNS